MTKAEIFSMLNGITGYSGKVAYDVFPVNETPVMPYITWAETGERVFPADGIAYFKAQQITVALFTKAKSDADEVLVETALTNNHIYYSKTNSFDENQNCYVTTYEAEV